MARAKRHYLPGHVWHIMHRCHKKEFLLKFARDRRRWVEWLFAAKKRYGLQVLNYNVTSNHIHLLVLDGGDRHVIPDSIKLIAGRTAQEYNHRKNKKGAFWEDRYHATAIESDEHLIKCLIYIDMNMVRTGVVNHPGDWGFCGYNEIQNPRQRYSIIDYSTLTNLLQFSDYENLVKSHKCWIDEALKANNLVRQDQWTQSIAVGSKTFLEKIKGNLKYRAKGRNIVETDSINQLRESQTPYGNSEIIDYFSSNLYSWS